MSAPIRKVVFLVLAGSETVDAAWRIRDVVAAYADKAKAERHAAEARLILGALSSEDFKAVRTDPSKRLGLNPIHPSFEREDEYHVQPVGIPTRVPRFTGKVRHA